MPDRRIVFDPDVACWLVLDHWRDRKTGPRFPIAVVRCVVHQRAFTLYPRGHVPYGYSAIASPGLFDAARDAAGRLPWAREGPRTQDARVAPGAGTWWGTQGRRLATAAQITGVAPDLTTDRRERIVEALGVDLLAVVDAVSQIRAAPGYVTRGTAALAVLALVQTVTLLQRLLVAGHLAGQWGPPLWVGADPTIPPPARVSAVQNRFGITACGSHDSIHELGTS